MMGGILSHLPFVRFIVPKLSGYHDLNAMLSRLWSYFKEEIDNHEENLTLDDPNNLIDTYLLEIKKHTDEEDTNFDREFKLYYYS
jgi:methyl farnesoate epoxidase/farnesoate epoxidase